MVKAKNLLIFKLIAIFVVIGLFLGTQNALAASTISANISTTGSLTVNGALQFTSGAALNYILQSDATGNATWIDPSGWDQNSSDDLTTVTAFGGDVSGVYSALTLGVNTVSDNEIDYTTVTLADFTNDANFGDLTVTETLSGNWVNTANPWADNEVADTLTIGASSTVADGALSANVSLLGTTIETGEITDNTITASDLSATLTFADADIYLTYQLLI